jgi:hypothetical protein
MQHRIDGTVKHLGANTPVFGNPMLLAFPRQLLKDLEEGLAQASSTEVGAEATYEIEQNDQVAYIQFTGDSALFGNSLD